MTNTVACNQCHSTYVDVTFRVAIWSQVLYKHMQNMLTPDSAVIAETGDSWFNCQKLKLPNGCGYEFQCQFGSIGWSVGATLGYAMGAAKNTRVIASIGDGSFQVRTLPEASAGVYEIELDYISSNTFVCNHLKLYSEVDPGNSNVLKSVLDR